MKQINYEIPTSISEIRRQWNWDFKPIFGRGTGAGDIKCPHCYCALGHLTEYPPIYPGVDLDTVALIGFVFAEHPSNDCPNAKSKVDLSNLQLRDLLVNVIPQDWTIDEYEEQITGPGMVYRPDLNRDGNDSDWVLDATKYYNYLARNAKKLLLDIGDRYGTLESNKDGSYKLETFGGVVCEYEDAIHGCDDWYGYIMDVVKDTPDAYEPRQIAILERIHKYVQEESR